MSISRLLSATALAGAAFVFPTCAYAQSSNTNSASTQDRTTTEESDDAASEREIVVVGSRIRRSNLTSADPVNVITRDETVSAGFNSTAQALQSTALTGGTGQINNAFGNFVTQGGPGANTLSLRGLGANRSLVLLNGRRVSPSGSRGQVGSSDLNVLPNSMLERIEVLNVGASSVYGSDAVAGVVNLVTRSNINGLELEAQHNVPESGVGATARYSALFGIKRDDFSISGSLEYTRINRVTYGDLDFTACQTSLRRTGRDAPLDSLSFIDPATGKPKCYGEAGGTGQSGLTVNTIGTSAFAAGRVVVAPGVPAGYAGNCDRFRPNPAVTTGALPGFECVGGGVLNIGIRDLLPKSLFSSDVLSSQELYNGFLQAKYDFGGIEVYGELLANRRNSEQIGNRQLVIDYPLGSPLLPAPLNTLRQFAGPQPGGITGTTPIGVRAFTENGTYSNRQNVDFVRGVIGVRGNMFADWRFDASVLRSWSDARYTTDAILTSKMAQAVDAVALPGGGFACRNPVGGCAPAPELTSAVIAGNIPQAFRDFITSPVTGTTKYRETIANATFDGSLFDLPGGRLAAAIGVEYRRLSIDDTPSIDSQRNNLYAFTASTPTRGKDAVREIFGELEAPLLANIPFAYRLTLNGSARYTDYDSYGSQATYKVGGLYAPTSWLSFRGSYGTSYRAPALFEQFLGSSSGFQGAQNDPCQFYGASFSPESSRYRNCASLGLAPDFNSTTSIAVNQRGGAETGLKAETSRAYSYGAVFEPKLGTLGTLSLSADYFAIKVKQGVSQLSYSSILGQCYDQAPADFASKAGTCGLIRRETVAPFNLVVTSGYLNISTSEVKGLDFAGRFAMPIGADVFRLNAQVTKFIKRYTQTLPTDPARNQVGSLGNPAWSGTFSAAYIHKRFTANYGIEWLDATETKGRHLGLEESALDTYYLKTPNYFLHSASVNFRADRFGITMGVRNLTNAKPPQISSGLGNRLGNAALYSGFDLFGRTFFVNVNTRF